MQHFDQFYKSWNFFTGCYTFDNFFQTEGNGQNSAEFIDFWKQLLPHSKQNKIKIRITRLFLVFMINLLVKQPQRGSNMNWSTSKTSLRIFSLSRSVQVLLPKDMWHVQNGNFNILDFILQLKIVIEKIWISFLLSLGRFLYTPLHFAAKNGKWLSLNLFFMNFRK